MDKKIIASVLFVAILIAGIILFNFYSNEVTESSIVIQEMTQSSPPDGGYCLALGYEIRINETEMGQQSICIFSDGTECDGWAFYRGKCGQEWSYCAEKGYDLKNLTDDEGWSWDGSVCIDKITKEEIGNVYTLVNEEWAKQNK